LIAIIVITRFSPSAPKTQKNKKYNEKRKQLVGVVRGARA